MDSWRDTAVPELPGRGPQPKIRDTASGELAVAAAGPEARLYACGITPYDATHIGHAATYVAWDLLIRAWRDAGCRVRYVQNVTDVDDPLLERAQATGAGWRALADSQIALFRSDMEALRVLPPGDYIGAVEALGLIERFNQRLGDRGALYELDSDVYFARSADAEFGAVSGLDPAQMTKLFAERGGDPARPGKKDPLDPLVWLARRPGEPSWDSGFGPGRPGWHVECAAIATHYLGPVFDVQAGGSDLIFPHHEMSASHARVALGGEAFARRYAHAGMVRLDGEKMSKSLGNLVFVSGLTGAGADPMAVRLAILAHHYRGDWDWTAQVLADAARRLARWRAAHAAVAAGAGEPAGVPAGIAVPAGAQVVAAMRERLADDLDAPGAVAAVDGWAAAVLGDGARPDDGADPAPGAGPGEGAAPALSADRPAGSSAGPGENAGLVRAAVDALLGISL